MTNNAQPKKSNSAKAKAPGKAAAGKVKKKPGKRASNKYQPIYLQRSKERKKGVPEDQLTPLPGKENRQVA